MTENSQVAEITRAILSLPPDKIVAVKDFVDFLKMRYGADTIIDESDEWTEEDIREFRTHCREYGETQAPWDDSAPEAGTNSNAAP